MLALDGVTGAMVGGTGSLGSQGGPMGPGAWGSTRAEASTAGGASQVEGASLDSEQAGETSASDRAPGSHLLEFAFTVPFLSYMDAEVARQCLIPLAEPYHGTVHWELTVAGSDLVIQLTAEDSDLLQISTASLLSQLSIVVQTLQPFVTPFFAEPHPAKGG